MNKRVFFKTFGCRTNQFDTQVMISKLEDYIVVLSEKEANTIVINSCTVTNGADTSVRSYINKIKKLYPRTKILLTGCGAFSKGKELLEQQKVNGVFGHSEKQKINNFMQQDNFYELGDLDSIDNSIVSEFVGKSRAFIKIQEGCDFECSYCIIPSVRGKAREHKEDTILEQIKILARNGFGEFILTGTNLGSYGLQDNRTIAKLIKKIALLKGVRRVRLGSLEPSQIDDEFLELLTEPWMAKHLHIAIQHSNDEMLKIMNRRNRVKDDLALFEKIALKGYAIGTDYIVGHPFETQDIWNSAITNIKEYPLTHIHAFTYSKRDHTLSANMSHQINGKIAKERLNELTNIIDIKNMNFRKSIKLPLKILIESKKYNYYTGFDQYFNKIHVQSNQDLKGNWIELDDFVVKDKINEAIL